MMNFVGKSNIRFVDMTRSLISFFVKGYAIDSNKINIPMKYITNEDHDIKLEKKGGKELIIQKEGSGRIPPYLDD